MSSTDPSPSLPRRRLTEAYLAALDRAYWRLRPHAMAYFALLDRIHQTLLPRTYLEIGVSRGGSLTLALPGTRCIAIDPDPKVGHPLISTTEIFAEESDRFFARPDLDLVLGDRPVDLAFIDGMHHFEFALRDFSNIEARASTQTAVLIHDCLPIDELSAQRERCPGEWSGDVWRLIVCLKEWRPDLAVAVLDIGPTGLGVVTGLEPGSSILVDHYDEIVARYLALPYSYLVEGDKRAVLNVVHSDWPTVRALLPSRPFRQEALAPLVTRRAARAFWVAGRSALARRLGGWTRRLTRPAGPR